MSEIEIFKKMIEMGKDYLDRQGAWLITQERIDALSAAIEALEKIKPESSVCPTCAGWGHINVNESNETTSWTLDITCPDCLGKGMK